MPILHGIFEVSMGAKSTASINVPLENKIILASILFGWSGLSISGQVASMIQRTKINVSPYFVAKVLHAALAGAIAKLLTYLMLPLVTASSINNTGNVQQNFFQTLRMSSSQVVLVTFVLFVSGLVVYFIHTKRPIRKKAKRLSHS